MPNVRATRRVVPRASRRTVSSGRDSSTAPDAEVAGHEPGGDLRAEQDAGDAGAGMRATADVVEAHEPAVAVRRAQPRGLVEGGLQGEGVAVDRAEVPREVRWRHAVLDEDGVAEARESERRLEARESRVAQAVGRRVPVDPGAQVRHGQ